MISRLLPRRRLAVAAGVVLAGGLVAGGATAFADTAAGTAPSSAAGTAHPAAGKHRHLRRPAALGVHGQATVKNRKTGQWVVREWQRGRITAVSGDTVTVRSADGTSWTWTVAKNAKITRDGGKIGESVLKDGDAVLVVGRRDGAANDAARILAPSPAQLAKLKARAAQQG